MRLSRPVNDNEVLADLDRRTCLRGSIERAAAEWQVDPQLIRRMRCGARLPNARIATALGWELYWIKKKNET
jgi:hypothetical protein